MRLKRLWIDGFKNLNDFELDFTSNGGVTVLIGNNGSGKSNVLEAISAIFTGLFKMGTPQRKPKFEYEIEYVLDEDNHYYIALKKYDDEYRYDFHKNLQHIPTGTFKANPYPHLPSNVIAIYSGEEQRLWDKYYSHLYRDFMSEVRRDFQGLPSPKLFYINRFFWDISLLSLLYSDLPDNEVFCKRIMHIESFETVSIKFVFNRANLANFSSNSIVNFVEYLSGEENEKTFAISELREHLSTIVGADRELFLKLMAAVMNKESKYKLIDRIEIKFGDLSIESLSEGEKKQILIRVALEILANDKSLLLMDEPDANIHVANKVQIKTMLGEYADANRESVLTTHSPTLMNVFKNHLKYLDNGELKGYEKAEILKDISGDTMSDAQRQILLNANTDILIVEGKTDEKYITVALEKLKIDNPEYENFEFNFLYMGGSDSENLKKIVDQFQPKENQTIIAFFDNDGAGFGCIKKAFDLTMDKVDFNGTVQNGINIHLYPKKDGFIQDKFEIEDYFKIETCRDFMFANFSTFQDTKMKFKKNDFANHCSTLDITEFEGFKKLFDLIVEIKNPS